MSTAPTAPAPQPTAPATPPAPAVEATPPVAPAVPDLAATPPVETPDLGAEPAAPPAPTGDFDFKPPEGFDKDPYFEGFKDFAKEQGLTGAQAQKLAERYSGLASAAKEQIQASHKQQVEAWGQAWQADKEIGGARVQESFEVAKRALEKFGTPELRALLRDSGLGRHPEVVRAFYRAGKAISEDSSAGVRGAAPGPVPGAPMSDEALAKQMYPDL